MKYFYIPLILMLHCFSFFGQDAPEKTIEKFFKTYSKDNGAALDTIFSSNKYFSKETTIELSKKLGELVAVIGEYCGEELIQKQIASKDFVLYNYIVKYERQPIKFTFIFYKPKESWVLYNFNFENNLEVDLQNASKISLFLKQE